MKQDFRNKIIEIQGKMFQVKRTFKEDKINLKKGSIKDLKILFHCDSIFKARGLLWICNEIKITEYEEI
tara:strand:+ start:25 stop:231 length:207 start_codon:yes stop_codon:yes gene_type:complete